MSKIVDYVSEDNKNDMLNDVRDSDYDAFVKLSQVFELNVFCPVHMEGEKDWGVAYLMNDAVESFLVFKDFWPIVHRPGPCLGPYALECR